MTTELRLPPDARPRGARPTLVARRLLFDLQARGHVLTVESHPLRLHVAPRPPAALVAEVCARAYELRDLLAEQPA